MANVKIKDIPFDERYVDLYLDDGILLGPMVANLRCLYEFIDRNAPGNSAWKYGNAYRAILRKARSLAGTRRYIISKKQVAALINPKGKEYAISIKIPYSSEYIFKAIFEIFDGYRRNEQVVIPSEIETMYGKLRREVFFLTQSEQYRYKFEHNLLNSREELRDIRRALVNDLCSDDCSLGKKV